MNWLRVREVKKIENMKVEDVIKKIKNDLNETVDLRDDDHLADSDSNSDSDTIITLI